MTASAPHRTALSAPRLRRASGRRGGRPYVLAPLVLISTNVILFGLFFAWPAIIGLLYSFTNYTGIGSFNFVGLSNYETLFGDSNFYAALLRTLLYTVVVVPVGFVFSLLIASLMVSRFSRGTAIARVVFFIPWLVSPIVAGVIWRWLFGENFGLVNYLVESFGGQPIPWQSNANLSLFVVVIASTWGNTAFSMLLFIAAIKNVPQSYYEAAALDGAGSWQLFRNITLPSIASTSFIVVLLGTINAMKEYALLQSLNNGGPGTSNNLLVQYIYQTGFQRGQIGYASAASFVLMIILMAIALAQVAINRKTAQR